MAKKKQSDTKFFADSQPRMSDQEKDQLFVHLLRCPGFFEESLERMPADILKDEEERYKVLMYGCRELAEKGGAKPGQKKFKALLKDAIRKYAQTLEGGGADAEVEAAEDVTGEGGLIDEAYLVDEADLSDDLARLLLRRFLYERQVVRPLQDLLQECENFHDVPMNLPEVMEKLLERARGLESIDARAVKSVEDEWEEHEKRLDCYRGRTMVGLKTGQKELDRRTLGLRGLFVFGAKPGAGKTTYAAVELAIGVCRHHADNDCVVIVVSLDMDRYELYRRIHCNLGNIEWAHLMFGSAEGTRQKGSMFSKADQNRLKKAKARLKNEQIGKRLAVPDRTVLGDDITMHRLASIIDEHKKKAKAARVLLIIDYLQLIPVPEEVMARGDLAADKYRVRLVQQVIERSRTADDPLGDTALVISEARKPPTSKDRDHWGDSMSELMGSARLGYAGDAVLLYREMSVKEMETYYGTKDKVAAEKRRDALHKEGIAPVTLILEKGRDGMTRGKWGAEFSFRKSTFRELVPNQHLKACIPPRDDEVGDGTTASGHLPLPPSALGGQPKAKKKSGKGSKKAK